MSLIELDNVVKNHRLGKTEVKALRGVSLVVEPGEFTALWGPSGSGKTTMLNLIGGLDDPTEGRVLFDGVDLAGLDDDDRSELRGGSVAFIFQSYNLLPVLSAIENVMLPLQLKGVSDDEAADRAYHRLAQVGLEPFLHNRPDNLSGGQRQRVAVARALVVDPKLVIADEPTANLDSENAEKITALMRDLNRAERTTFLISSHDRRVIGLCDRHIRLRDGEIREDKRLDHERFQDAKNWDQTNRGNGVGLG